MSTALGRLSLIPRPPRTIPPPGYERWVESRAYVHLVATAGLVIVLFPLFHFTVALLPGSPPDSLAARLAVAALSALLVALATFVPRLRPHAPKLQIVNALGVLAGAHYTILYNGNPPLLYAAVLLVIFGAQLGFVRSRDWVLTAVISLWVHLAMSWHAGVLAVPAGWIATITYVNAYVIATAFLALRVSAQRREFEAGRQITQQSLELEGAYEALDAEKGKSERLLLNMLPPAIAQRLKKGSGSIADNFEEVSVLFADIVGFTALAEQASAVEVVALLNDVFSEFDALCAKHGLEKIKTIGDAYMAVCGAPDARKDHASAVAELALSIQQAVKHFRTPDGRVLSVRVGVHSGPVVAGVIGLHRYAYDLWGDTVNTASRMESHGVSGRIQCTAAIVDRLQGRYRFEERGEIEIKGKGRLPTWFLTGRVEAA